MDPAKPIPDHVGKSIKLTQGYAVNVHFPTDQLSVGQKVVGKTNGFYRHLFSLDTYDWLMTNVGNTCSQHLWEEGQGDWLFTGGGWIGIHQRSGNVPPRYRQSFRFRDHRKAILFKLRWDERF